MIYQFDSRVRYSEVDENRRITLLSILNYFQDCSSFHSEKIGFGIDYLKEKQCAWVLSSWQIVLGELPVFGQEITVQTWPYSFKGFLGERNFCIRDEKGEKLAWANTLWTYVDLKTGHPTRVPKEEQEAYVLHEKLDMDYAPRKILLPEETQPQESFTVQKHHLDTHHHVNNCQYIRMGADYLPEGFEIRQMRAEYKKQALLGDVFYPAVKLEMGKVTVALSTENGEPYAIVEFMSA